MLIRIDPTLQTPLFAQLASAVRAAIIDGRVVGGEPLPAARVLARTLGVNMHTVLRGYQLLRDEGLIELQRGRGAVVATRIGGHAALAGAVHDLVDEAKLHDLPESALLALVSEAYRWTPPAAGVLRGVPTR
ncbi:GntR family transcriptional regulator [Agromyces sp. NPDC058484]|uniref:GntR family transcriptional regulator n=1 Tax=Agromyces sp. NPDC058484 TaxID=3346524 RepID=UPI003666EEF2